jgi:hypothetical protein
LFKPTPFPALLEPTRQSLADALGVVLGVMVVRRGGYGGAFEILR